MENLKWTGERLVTDIDDVYGKIEHLHRYAIAQNLTQNKVVLDIACGEGYGSNLLSKNAQLVYGVDIDSESIAHATEKYKKKNLHFLKGSTSKIPLKDNSIDIIISFETIEHHDEQEQMFKEFKRVLKDDGLVLISSPEKSIYSERDPNNIYHIKELTIKELKYLADSFFSYNSVFSQLYFTGSVILPENEDLMTNFKTFDGDYNAIKRNLDVLNFFNQKYFNLILLSDNSDVLQKNEKHIASIFNGYNVYKKEIDFLKSQIEALKNENILLLKSRTYRLLQAISKPYNFLKKIGEK